MARKKEEETCVRERNGAKKINKIKNRKPRAGWDGNIAQNCSGFFLLLFLSYMILLVAVAAVSFLSKKGIILCHTRRDWRKKKRQKLRAHIHAQGLSL